MSGCMSVTCHGGIIWVWKTVENLSVFERFLEVECGRGAGQAGGYRENASANFIFRKMAPAAQREIPENLLSPPVRGRVASFCGRPARSAPDPRRWRTRGSP